MNERVEKTLLNLKKNNIDARFVQSSAEAVELIREMLFEGALITAGGSVSLAESGVWALINGKEYNFRDRNREGITEDEKQSVFKDAIGADFFFSSANALTERGELINVDGYANRVSALAFGPKKVIVVAGVNKIVADAKEGFLRVKKIAAPKNCVRLNKKTPCAAKGFCAALQNCDTPDITDGCQSPDRICRHYTITGKQESADRITVILVNENLGY